MGWNIEGGCHGGPWEVNVCQECGLGCSFDFTIQDAQKSPIFWQGLFIDTNNQLFEFRRDLGSDHGLMEGGAGRTCPSVTLFILSIPPPKWLLIRVLLSHGKENQNPVFPPAPPALWAGEQNLSQVGSFSTKAKTACFFCNLSFRFYPLHAGMLPRLDPSPLFKSIPPSAPLSWPMAQMPAYLDSQVAPLDGEFPQLLCSHSSPQSSFPRKCPGMNWEPEAGALFM